MLAALSFTGCRNEAVEAVTPVTENEVIERPLTIIASGAQTETRTIMEGDKEVGFNTAWTQATDKLGVYSYNADASSTELTMNANFAITSIIDGVATFEGDIRFPAEGDMEYDLYAYYPRNAANYYENSTYDNVTTHISEHQTMHANGTHDATNDIMVALPGQKVTIANGQIDKTTLDNFQFRYLVGFMNLSIADEITAEGITADDVVRSVKITADGTPTIAGAFALNLANGEMVSNTPSNEITLTVHTGVTLGELDAWVVVNPFATEKLTFLITTETHTIEKSATVEGFSIPAGGIKTFEMAVDANCTITELNGVETPFDGYYNSWTASASWGKDRTLSPIISSEVVTLGDMIGTGFVASSTAAGRTWGTTGFSSSSINSDLSAPTIYATFTVTSAVGTKLSFTGCDAIFRLSSTGPRNLQLQYQIGNGDFQEANTWTGIGTSSSGSKHNYDLSTVEGLQNIDGGQVVAFRLVPYGATATSNPGGVWYLYSPTNTEGVDRSFGITGTIIVP